MQTKGISLISAYVQCGCGKFMFTHSFGNVGTASKHVYASEMVRLEDKGLIEPQSIECSRLLL